MSRVTSDHGCSIHLNLGDWCWQVLEGSGVGYHHLNQSHFQIEPFDSKKKTSVSVQHLHSRMVRKHPTVQNGHPLHFLTVTNFANINTSKGD